MQLLLFTGVTLYICGIALGFDDDYDYTTPPEETILDLDDGPSIVGGTPTSIEHVPFQAAIFGRMNKIPMFGEEDTFIGSGAIVGRYHVLTSGSMVNDTDFLSVHVRVGSSDCVNGGQFFDVKDLNVHEALAYMYSYDVALLQLTNPIRYGSTAKPIRMASQVAANGTTAQLCGFTSVEERDMTKSSAFMKKGMQTVMDWKSCSSYYDPKIIPFDESFICAYNETVCACNRDHGSPLVQNNEVIGFYVGGSFCCDDTNPQLYMEVSNIKQWVEQRMKDQGYDIAQNEGHYFGE